MTLRAIFSILNNVSIRRNICLNFRKFIRENKPLFWQKWTPDVFYPISGHHVCVPRKDTNMASPYILISINLCGTLCQITRERNTSRTWCMERVLIYLSSITCQFLDFIQWMVFDFYFDGVTVKTGNIFWDDMNIPKGNSMHWNTCSHYHEPLAGTGTGGIT